MKNFNYYQSTEIFFGRGRLTECGQITAKYGKKALIVTVPLFDAIKPGFDTVKQTLEDSGLSTFHFDGVVPNPTCESITKGAALAKSCGADVIVGFGGGSSMDTAKAIAVEVTHEGTAWDYLFFKREPTKKTLPIVAITTTSGTGSQVTQVSVLTNTEKRDKSAIFHPNIYPKAAIVDPELMLTVPKAITAATGFDAFTHAFESIVHARSSVYARLLAWEGVRLVIKNLKNTVEDGSNIDLREVMAWADTLGGLSIANAGTTLPHGMGMAIGGMYPNVAHGQGLAMTYPAFIRFSQASAPEAFARLARLLDPALEREDTQSAAAACAVLMEKFLAAVNLDLKLKDFGMPENEIEALADQCMVLPDYENNPRVATKDEMIELVREIYG